MLKASRSIGEFYHVGTGQRGHVRLESGNFVGYWNTYSLDSKSGKHIRRQRCKKLGPRSMGKFQAYEALRGEIEKGTNGIGSDVAALDSSMTLEQYARERWIPTQSAKWRRHVDEKGIESCSAKTSTEYILKLIFQAFGNNPLDKLDPAALQTWLNHLAETRSDSLVKHCRYYLKSVLKRAVWEQVLRRNPAEYLTLPHTRAVRKDVLTAEQFTALIAKLDEKHSLLIRIAVFCAFRPSELLALRWKDFDSVSRTFTIRETLYRGVLRPFSKTTDAGEMNTKLLTVAVPDELAEELAQYRKTGMEVRRRNGTTVRLDFSHDKNFIFCTPWGSPLHKENILNRVFKPVKEKLGLPALNFQVLRRSMATWSQHSGSVKDVQAHLRHKRPDITAAEYIQTVPESARNMVNTVYGKMMPSPKL
jgi:integrase